MSAVAVQSEVCVCGSDHLCACGCGQPIHPKVRRVHELLAAGAKVMQVARLLEIDKAQVGAYRDKPPRFRKGHAVNAEPKPMVVCANPNCGRLFRQMGPNHLYCTYASRPHSGSECASLASEHKQSLWRQYDEGVGTRAAQRLIASERRTYGIVTATLDEMAQVGADYEAAAAIARQAITTKRLNLPKLKYPQAEATMERLVAEHRQNLSASVDNKIAALLERVRWRTKARRHDETIVAQAISRSPELAELIAEQERDARWGDRMPKWVLSLQRKVGEDGVLGDLIPSPDSDDPYQTLLGQLLRECLAGRDLDDIEALDDWTREWLQSKLIESGLGSAPLVTAADRQLWLPPERAVRRVTRPTHWQEAESLGGQEKLDEFSASDNALEVAAVFAVARRDLAAVARRSERAIRDFQRREKSAKRTAKREQRRADKVAAMRER